MMVAISWSSCYRQIVLDQWARKYFCLFLVSPGKYPTWRHVTPAGSCRELLTPIIQGMSKVWSVHQCITPWSWPRDTESDLRRQGTTEEVAPGLARSPWVTCEVWIVTRVSVTSWWHHDDIMPTLTSRKIRREHSPQLGQVTARIFLMDFLLERTGGAVMKNLENIYC